MSNQPYTYWQRVWILKFPTFRRWLRKLRGEPTPTLGEIIATTLRVRRDEVAKLCIEQNELLRRLK